MFEEFLADEYVEYLVCGYRPYLAMVGGVEVTGGHRTSGGKILLDVGGEWYQVNPDSKVMIQWEANGGRKRE